MTNSNSGNVGPRQRMKIPGAGVSLEHYWRLILHRKWLVLAVFVLVSVGATIYAKRLPNIYSSDTTILVDPQKVPENYVKSTVSGDIRNRLGAISNQVLSATRLQRIIEELNLYPEEKKKMTREDIILKMHGDITTTILQDFGGSQDLQAFRITYSGRDPRIVSQVANKLATAFIDENTTARNSEAVGTMEFFDNQVTEAKKILEGQEAKIREFKQKHIGEMPEQQTSALAIMGQLQGQLQLETEALSRAEDQKRMLESLASQPMVSVVDMDPPVTSRAAATATAPAAAAGRAARPVDPLTVDKTELQKLLARYGPKYPDVKRLQDKIAQEEAQLKAAAASETIAVPAPAAPKTDTADADAAPAPAPETKPARPVLPTFNPIIQTQLKNADAEIARIKDDKQKLAKQLDSYRGRLDAIPLAEQEIASLTRDYELSRVHYGQLLDRKMNAETASELEARQKGEKFEVIDAAMPAESPSRPNRKFYYAGGVIAGLVLGLLAALGTELLGMSITDSQDVLEAGGVNVLGVIPVILTQSEKSVRRRRLILAAASFTIAAMVGGTILFLKMYNPA